VNVSRRISKDVLLIATARTPAGERACLFCALSVAICQEPGRRFLEKHLGIKDGMLKAFRVFFATAKRTLTRSPTFSSNATTANKDALLASARYRRIEFTFTEKEHRKECSCSCPRDRLPAQ
jgi:hypothetical protein